MKTKRIVLRTTIALAVLVTMVLGTLPVTSVKAFAADVSQATKASQNSLIKGEDFVKLENGKTYKVNNNLQYANFQGKEWLVAGHINSDSTGGKDGLVLWSRRSVGKSHLGVEERRSGGAWGTCLVRNCLNSDKEQYLCSYNINNMFTKSAKSLVIPVTVEDWHCKNKSYNNYLYIADRNTSGSGIFLGTRIDELQISFEDFAKINILDKESDTELGKVSDKISWLRSWYGATDLLNLVNYYYTVYNYNGHTQYVVRCSMNPSDPKAIPIYDAQIVPAFVMDLSKVVLASTSPDAASLSDGNHLLSWGNMTFRFQNDEKIKSTMEYTDDYLSIKKPQDEGDIYLCIQYASPIAESVVDQIYTKKITYDTIIKASDIGINSFKNCTVWLEKTDSTDNLVYAKEGTYYSKPTLTYTSYGEAEEFTPYAASSKTLGRVSVGGFAPTFNVNVTAEVLDKSGNPASTSLKAAVEDGELVISTVDATGPGSYDIQIKASDGNTTVRSEKIPVTVSKLDHIKNEKSLSVAAESEETYTSTLFHPAEGGSYGTPKTEGTIQAANIKIDASGSDKKITFTVPSCKDGSTGKIIIPVTGCKEYNDYNIVINLSADNKSVTYWSKADLEDFGKGKTYYIKSGVLQKASFAGREWYAIGAEENADNKKGLVLLSASSICDRVYNSGYNADYATSDLNNALNSNGAPYNSEACNINQLFTTAERACLLAVNVDYSLESTAKTANSVQLYVPDGSADASLYNDTVLLGHSNTFKLLIKDWKGANSGFFWCRSRVNSDGRVYAANLNADWKCLSESYVNEDCRVVPQMDLDLSKVLFASAAPAASSTGTTDVTPNDTMVFRFAGTDKLKSTLVTGEKEQTYEITKSADDKQPVYLCAQYNTAIGTKIYTQLITENTVVDLSSIFAVSSDVTIWIETTSADGRMVFAKKVQPAFIFNAVDPKPAVYTNTENLVTLGTVEVRGYSESDVVFTAAVFESDAPGAAAISDGTMRAYVEDGKLCLSTTTGVKEGNYCVKVFASSQYFTETLSVKDSVSVVKRDCSPSVLSMSVAQGTKKYTISDYIPNSSGTLGAPVTSGELNLADVKVEKKYSSYNISFTATDAKAGQTGRIEIPVSNCKKSNDYKLVISVICAGNALTWYTRDTLKTLGNNGVYYKDTNSLLKADFAGRTWAVVGAENSVNTGSKDTLVMVSTGSVAVSVFNEADSSGANYEGSKMYKLLNSSNSAYANLDGNAHKLFGDAIKYVVPVTINYTDENGGTATTLGNYLYLPDGDTNIGSINLGTTGSYSMLLNTFTNNVNAVSGNQSFCWLRSAAKLNYLKSIVKTWRAYIGERFIIAEGGSVIPEFNLDLQNVLFASPAAAAQEGTVQVTSNSNLVFRFRDAEIFDGKVYFDGAGTAVNVLLNKTYSDSVYLCVQYEEDGIEKLYSALVTSGGTVDLKDNVKGNLSTAHIWLEMKDPLSGIVYAALSEVNAHAHSWQYGVSEDGKSLEAWCGTGAGSNCEYSKDKKVSLTLDAQNSTYSSATYEASITGTEAWTKAGLEIPRIYYEGAEGTSYVKTEQPPYNAGTYRASISAGEGAGETTASVQFTISKRMITVTGTTVENKIYDGTDVATVNLGSVEGIVDGDDVKVGATAAFADNDSNVHAGENKNVKVEYTLTGKDAVNYEVSKAEDITASIVQKFILVTAKSVASVKGSPLAALTYTSDKLVEGDSFSGVLETDADITAAGTYAINQGNLSAGSNYSIIFTNGIYTVTEKQTRTISFDDTTPVLPEHYEPVYAAAIDREEKLNEEEAKEEAIEEKLFNELKKPLLLEEAPLPAETVTPPAIVNGNITITYGDLSGFTQTVKEAVTVTYSSSNNSVATVNPSTGEVTIVGAGSAIIKAVAAATEEYAEAEATYTLTVLKKPVDVPEVAAGLVYNGNEQTGVSVDTAEDALYTEVTGSVHAATNAGAFTCTLQLKNDNYIWATAAPTTENRNLKWNIGKKRLSVTGSKADKEYDGSVETTVIVGEITGVIEKAGIKEDVAVTAEGEFEHPNAADDKQVWIDYSLTGNDKDNYLEPLSELIDAKITPKKLSISGTSVADKEYDGTRSAVAVCGTLSGKALEGDDVEVLGWAAFTDKNAGKNKDVIVVYTLMGDEAGNYEAPDMETLTANITKATVNVEAMSPKRFVGTLLSPLEYTYDRLFDGDSFSGELETNANVLKAGKYSITQGTLSAGDNYIISFTPGIYEVEKKLTQSIKFLDIENNRLSKTVGDPDYENKVNGACSAVVLKSSNEGVAVIDGMKVKIVGPGTAVITAVAEENEIYASAEAKYTLTVKPTTNPGTGDSNNVLPYIIMMAAALLTIGLVILRRKKTSD